MTEPGAAARVLHTLELTPILPAFGEVSTLSSQTLRSNKGGRAQCDDDIKRSSVFSLFTFNFFRSIQVSISCTQASNLHLLKCPV